MFMYILAPELAIGRWKIEIEAFHSTSVLKRHSYLSSSQLRIIIILAVNLGNSTSIVVACHKNRAYVLQYWSPTYI